MSVFSFNKALSVLVGACLLSGAATAQIKQSKQPHHEDKFRQLEESWPTPNDQRIASGKPGPATGSNKPTIRSKLN